MTIFTTIGASIGGVSGIVMYDYMGYAPSTVSSITDGGRNSPSSAVSWKRAHLMSKDAAILCSAGGAVVGAVIGKLVDEAVEYFSGD